MKILTILLCMFLLVGTVSACDFQRDYGQPYTDTGIDYHDTITSAHGGIRLPTMIDSIQKPETQTAIRAWQYEDIEIE